MNSPGVSVFNPFFKDVVHDEQDSGKHDHSLLSWFMSLIIISLHDLQASDSTLPILFVFSDSICLTLVTILQLVPDQQRYHRMLEMA